jgi:hypothetical protein
MMSISPRKRRKSFKQRKTDALSWGRFNCYFLEPGATISISSSDEQENVDAPLSSCPRDDNEEQVYEQVPT